MLKKVCEVQWIHHGNGSVTLVFLNNLTAASLVKTYKTRAAAKGAETKFINRMTRIYGNKAV